MSVSFCLSHPVAVSAFIICSGLCVCVRVVMNVVLSVCIVTRGAVGDRV